MPGEQKRKENGAEGKVDLPAGPTFLRKTPQKLLEIHWFFRVVLIGPKEPDLYTFQSISHILHAAQGGGGQNGSL